MTGAAQTVPEIRQHLREVAATIRAEIAQRQPVNATSYEWAALPIQTRMAIALLSGVDGTMAEIAGKKFHEYSMSERAALQVATRNLYRELADTFSLRLGVGHV